jgi:hypothetical protein
VEHDQSAGLKMPGKLAQHVGCISLIQQHVPTDDGIEGFLEGHLGRIAFAKRDIPDRARFRSSAGRHNSSGSSVNADDGAFITSQIGRQERDIAATAAYIKNSHPRDNAGADEELSGDRLQEPGLRAQTLEFTI